MTITEHEKKVTQAQARRVLRFRNLKERGIVENRVTLRRWQLKQGFPKGILLGDNSVGFFEDEVQAWLATRPRQHDIEPTNRARDPGDLVNTGHRDRSRRGA